MRHAVKPKVTAPATPTLTIQEFPLSAVSSIRLPNYSKMTIKEVVESMMQGYAEDLLKYKAMPHMPDNFARQNANSAWLSQLPDLEDKQSVLQFIACVAWGARMRIMDGAEAKMLMFMAQTQLTALKSAPASPASPVSHSSPASPASQGITRPEPGRVETLRCLTCTGVVYDQQRKEFGPYCSEKCLTKAVSG
jgi:hypothetical protein